MLLDEPTSNLDSLNEAVILKSLHEQCAGKTVVLVSHRASTMRITERLRPRPLRALPVHGDEDLLRQLPRALLQT